MRATISMIDSAFGRKDHQELGKWANQNGFSPRERFGEASDRKERSSPVEGAGAGPRSSDHRKADLQTAGLYYRV